MYRFDYHSSYRYGGGGGGGMNNDGCKRCLEARERVGYQNSFNNGYNANRFNMNGNGMHPPYFRNNFAPMHGNMFDQRFNSNHFGSNSYRYGNNYPTHMPNGGQCHSDNCNVMHRPQHQHQHQQNHHMPANDSPYGNGNLYNHSRPHCSRDSMEHGGGGGGGGGSGGAGMNNHHLHHGNFNNSANRCSHDLKLREMINAPMQPRQPMRHESGSGGGSSNSQNNSCRSCDSKKTDEPSTSGMAAGNSSSAASTSNATASGSNSVPINNNENQVKNIPMNNGEMPQQQQQQHACSQHTKNQCCVKNYCCNVPNDNKPKCCRNEMHHMG